MPASRSSPANLVDSSGRPITVSQLLGRGGEGNVYALSAADRVVKVYHDPIKPTKQDKLKAMVQGQTTDLLRIATWPVDTAHDARTRATVGFIMPKLSGFKEIHTLYSPAQRKQEYPDADWSFLIFAARNVAAAIGTLHALGHVVGDINPKNVVVGKDATVKLIDCDSFQIRATNRQYLCEVGVPHFTPPELHGKALSTTVRNINHDGFGLALLCFHLLFMGRHPFAGKYQNGTADMPIEKAIREFRFAYGTMAGLKQMIPPPNAPTMALVPSSMQRMFDTAFGQEGVWGKRPSAANWLQELDILQKSLRTCAVIPSHKFHRTISKCPWCDFETHASIIFFVYSPRTAPRVVFNVDAVWTTIQAVVAPGPAQLPDFTYSAHAKPFTPPAGITLQQSIELYRQELQLRKAAVASATQQLENARILWSQHQSDRSFEHKYNQLRQICDKCQTLLREYQIERRQHEQQARELQLREYLKKYLIERAKINGIGPTRAATLASYGIETAADISQSQVLGIPGFGPTLTQELLKWRKGLEASFKYNPTKVVQQQALIQLDLRVAAKLAPHRQALEAGAGELERLRHNILAQRQQLIHDLKQFSVALDQAKADVACVSADLHVAQRQQVTQWLEQRRRLLTQTKTRLTEIGAQLRAARELARKESAARKRKIIFQTVLSLLITGCLVAVIAYADLFDNLKCALITCDTVPAMLTAGPPTVAPTRSMVDSSPMTPILPLATPVLPTPEAVPTLANSVIATTTMISRVYEMAGPDSAMIQDIPQGTEVLLIGRISSSIWCQARLSDGREGWLYCIFLKTSSPLDSVPIVLPTTP